jgi:hypothetical protein
MLKDLDNLLTTRSNLQRKVLDTLHGNGVEIVSPNFMNTRTFPEDRHFVPASVFTGQDLVDDRQDAVVFDKAMDAEALEKSKQELTTAIETLEAELKESAGDEKNRLTELIAAKRTELKELQTNGSSDTADKG